MSADPHLPPPFDADFATVAPEASDDIDGHWTSMETIVELCKRRGIIFQSSEIYGGLRGAWDYGPLGVALKDNVRDAWRRHMFQLRDDVVPLEASILMHPKVWEASGHVGGFTDPLVECRSCNSRLREDQLPTNKKGEVYCPTCGQAGQFTDAKAFNLMFRTFVGPTEDTSSLVWMRPETAQGMFVDYAHVQLTSRKKIPFGIGQIGRSFRNEITPRNFIFRVREFEQMEMEFFCKPGTDEQWHDYWIRQRWDWYTDLGLRAENLRIRPHASDELSHYSKGTVDIEYRFPMGWGEIEGIANRGTFDLTQHAEHSGKDLSYFDPATEERYIPTVIEPAAGVDRIALTFLVDAYTEEEAPAAKGGTEKRTVLKLHPDIAPVKVAVLPLSKKETLTPTARQVNDLLKPHFRGVDYDEAGQIGRRYRRQDEVGTPFCVTVDFETVEDDRAVTVRDRDTMSQERIPI
ncbi:MAG TPA: glycine--tRNA ligase, partial [Euzebya sp.]|nr:glycine--tRNA ligase [Euzebya sp.]